MQKTIASTAFTSAKAVLSRNSVPTWMPSTLSLIHISGHSLSVSDIVALRQNGVVSCHYAVSYTHLDVYKRQVRWCRVSPACIFVPVPALIRRLSDICIPAIRWRLSKNAVTGIRLSLIHISFTLFKTGSLAKSVFAAH